MTPPISTHNELATALFRAHDIAPTKVLEADDERVVSSLVVSGLGMALMREDVALDSARAGEIYLWKDVRLATRSSSSTCRSANRIPSSARWSIFSRMFGSCALPKGRRSAGNRRLAA
jgi:hypothetical protein